MTSLFNLPFFCQSELPAFETRVYDDGRVRIEVQPGHRGLATIWDRNILSYAFQVAHGEEGVLGSKVCLRPDDFFKTCMFSPLDQSAHGLEDALARLQSTSIQTTIENERGERERQWFSWIRKASVQTREEGVRTVVETITIELADWIFQPVFENHNAFQTSPGVFTVTSGTSWRVNDLAKRHAGSRKRWSTNLASLGNKLSYSIVERRRFAREIQHILADNDLPNFEIAVRREALDVENQAERLLECGLCEEVTVVFTKRKKQIRGGD